MATAPPYPIRQKPSTKSKPAAFAAALFDSLCVHNVFSYGPFVATATPAFRRDIRRRDNFGQAGWLENDPANRSASGNETCFDRRMADLITKRNFAGDLH